MDQVALGSVADQMSEIDLTTFAGACDFFGLNHERQNVHFLRFELGPYVAGRTYTVSTQGNLTNYAYWELTGSNCELLSPNQGGGGEADGYVTFTDVSPTAVRGTFDLTFSSGHITGSFDAPFCTRCDPRSDPNCLNGSCTP